MSERAQVVPLGEVGTADLAVVGGKAANLGELISAGFDVPPGFVVTVEAHARAEDARVGPELFRQIEAAYDALGAPAVAVRSSGTAEDLPTASFAGQHDTFLDVTGAGGVAEAVERCWASLRSDRAVGYRAQHGFSEDSVGIAVVVQQMAPHEVSGVVFTVNPLSGNRDELLVNATRGSGEKLVSGAVVPDQWVARRRDGAVVSSTPARSPAPALMMRTSAARPVLTSDQVRELSLLALRIEDRFAGVGQDIEWSFGAGSYHILQARPVTAVKTTKI